MIIHLFRKIPITESESSLPLSQNSSTGPYPEPVQSSSNPQSNSVSSNLCLSYLSGFFLCKLLTKIFYTMEIQKCDLEKNRLTQKLKKKPTTKKNTG